MQSIIQFYLKYDPKGLSVILSSIQLRTVLPITCMLDLNPSQTPA